MRDNRCENPVESEMGGVFDEPALLALDSKKLTGVIKTPASIARRCEALVAGRATGFPLSRG